MPFDNAVWQCHLTMPFVNVVWQCRLTTPFDNTVWQRRLTTPFDSAVWLRRLTTPFDYAAWSVADAYSFKIFIHPFIQNVPSQILKLIGHNFGLLKLKREIAPSVLISILQYVHVSVRPFVLQYIRPFYHFLVADMQLYKPHFSPSVSPSVRHKVVFRGFPLLPTRPRLMLPCIRPCYYHKCKIFVPFPSKLAKNTFQKMKSVVMDRHYLYVTKKGKFLIQFFGLAMLRETFFDDQIHKMPGVAPNHYGGGGTIAALNRKISDSYPWH